jgi:hypothetical protein
MPTEINNYRIRMTGWIVVLSLAFAFMVTAVDFIWLAYGNFSLQHRDDAGFGWMVFLNILGSFAAAAGVLFFLHWFVTNVGASVFNYIGKVFLGIWGVAITIAVGFLVWQRFAH